MSSGPHILVVEDDRVVAETLQLYLEHAGYRVTAVHDGASGVARAVDPDVAAVILDWLLPAMSGYDVCRIVRSRSAVPILMLTARTTEEDRVRGLECGADDYVGKPFSVHELLARVRAQVRRDDWHADAGTKVDLGDIHVDLRHRLVLRRGRRVALSAREFELLRYLLAHRNEVVSREQLLREVWGYSELSVSRTVDNYVARLRTRIEPRPHRPRFIVTVHGSGYQLLT
jgi:DNA-binding response OmpR family regulator